MKSNDENYIEKSIPRTATVPPPPRREERSIPSTQPTPPPSKDPGGKK